MVGTGAPEVVDTTHFEFSTVALRNKVSRKQRKWGMIVTVNADPTPANNTLWMLVEDLVDNDKLNNANWQKFNEWLDGQGFASKASPALTGNPTAPTQAPGTNNTTIANTAFVTAAIAALINGAPGALDTLEEIANALNDDANLYTTLTNLINTKSPKVIGVAVSDETTALTAGNGKLTFRMPYAITLTAVRASLVTAQGAGTILTIDINEGGVTILSTKLTIDNGEKTSTTAATAAVISDAVLADDAEITIDIDQIGDGTAKGLKIWLIGT
jgi:hypothetical protein